MSLLHYQCMCTYWVLYEIARLLYLSEEYLDSLDLMFGRLHWKCYIIHDMKMLLGLGVSKVSDNFDLVSRRKAYIVYTHVEEYYTHYGMQLTNTLVSYLVEK